MKGMVGRSPIDDRQHPLPGCRMETMAQGQFRLRRMRPRLVVMVAWILITGACSGGANPVQTSTTESPPVVSTTPAVVTMAPSTTGGMSTTVTSVVTPPPDHHIMVRVVDGVGEFYDRSTGERFVPRGMNYVRLGRQTTSDGSSTYGHALFDPGRYDPAVARADLEKMHADGYNVIRVFLSPDTMGTPHGGLSSEYMANVVDLLGHAEANDLYVMFTLDWIPGGTYGDILSADCCTEFALMNANFLPAAGLRANEAFFHDFASELIRRHAFTTHVFSYQLRNEMFYDGDQPPLSFTSGTVTTANGRTYDMASDGDRQAMLEENSVFWLDSVRTAIQEVDPTALVSVGFFMPHGPNPARIGDPRIVVSAPAIWQSTLDFIDLHAYPGFELDLLEHLENFGMNGMQEMPILMGEFGGEVSRFGSITAAALAFRDWQVESCVYGFDGWIFWTWDLDEQPDFFNALMEGGAINGVLAPVLRPDPCVP